MNRIHLLLILFLLSFSGCASPGKSIQQADRAAQDIIFQAQQQYLGKTNAISIASPSDTFRRRLFELQDLPYSDRSSINSNFLKSPEKWLFSAKETERESETEPPGEDTTPITLSLIQALQIGARNSRQYQTLKEDIFVAALDLDLERQEFRHTLTGLWDTLISTDLGSDPTISGVENTGSLSWSKRFKSGLEITTLLGIDLVKLLTLDKASSFGIFADASISMPLLRGAGRTVVTEPMTQADREVVYAMYRFERFKKTYSIQVTRQYLTVLQQLEEVANGLENYRNLTESALRVRRLADAGRLPEIQLDQAIQDSLRAKNRFFSAKQSYNRSLDFFKLDLGLPPDAAIELDYDELNKIIGMFDESFPQNDTPDSPSSLEDETDYSQEHLVVPEISLDEKQAIELALHNRLDLRISQGRVYDRQRAVIIAADGLLPEASLTGTANFGERRSIASAGEPTGRLRPERGNYGALLSLDFPFDKTAERNILRTSLINLEDTVRTMQELEDQIKVDVRNHIRNLLILREQIHIQAQSVKVAQRRVDSTNLHLKAGRVHIRDLLEAQEALVQAKNSLSASRTNYRISELELQQDLGILQVDNKGLYQEFQFDERRQEQ